MNTEKVTIKNRKGLNLVIQLDTPDHPSKLAFIAHGQKGSLHQKHIDAFAEAFLENNFRVVRFDATHALGESEGDVQFVTYDTYISDLEDVIEWARAQAWFQTPFALCGHSMGAQSTTWYAEHHPEQVSLLAPMAPVVNYELWQSARPKEEIDQWQQLGYQDSVSKSTGKIVRIDWQVNESMKKFDILPQASKLTMPLLDIVGELDDPCPVRNQELFIDAVGSSNKTLEIIPGLEHSYRDAHSDEYTDKLMVVRDILSNWLRQTS